MSEQPDAVAATAWMTDEDRELPHLQLDGVRLIVELTDVDEVRLGVAVEGDESEDADFVSLYLDRVHAIALAGPRWTTGKGRHHRADRSSGRSRTRRRRMTRSALPPEAFDFAADTGLEARLDRDYPMEEAA